MQAELLKKYQQSLKRQTIDGFDDLSRIASDIRVKVSVWRALSEIEFAEERWREMVLLQADLHLLEAETLQWYRTALRAERELPDNNVVSKMLKNVVLYRTLVACCQNLTNKTLKDRHWDRIYSTTGLKLNIRNDFEAGRPCTIDYILKSGIVEHKDLLQRISQEVCTLA